MKNQNEFVRAWASSAIWLGAATLCGCGGDLGGGTSGVAEQPILNGTPVSDAANLGAVAVYHQDIRPCSGTMIRRQWVLTARHCLTIDGEPTGTLRQASEITVVRASSPGLQPPASGGSVGQAIVADSGQDIALVRIFPEIPFIAGLWNGNTAQLQGLLVRAMGYGRNVIGGDLRTEDGTSGAGTLRSADLSVASTATTTFNLTTDASGQNIWHGDSGGPSFRLTDTLGRNLWGVAGVHQTSDLVTFTDGSVAGVRGWIKRSQLVPGDINGNRRSDIMLTGGATWNTIPVAAASEVTGGFVVTNSVVSYFPGWAATPGAKAVSGDFNGDGLADIALAGVSGWTTIPIAFSNGNGTFNAVARNVTDFPGWAALGARVVSGDFNGDGRADIALTGVSGWNSIPIAFSNGDGAFNVSNVAQATFPGLAAVAGAKVISGDFDGDGRDDLALTGVSGWGSVPVAFSNGDGTFTVRNYALANFPGWAASTFARAVSGDFNGDGRDDIALTGGEGWGSVPVAFSNGDGTFTVTNAPMPTFPALAARTEAKVVSGDFNGDRRDDLALLGVPGWTTIPVAFSNGDGSFSYSNTNVPSFPAWSSSGAVTALSGHRGILDY